MSELLSTRVAADPSIPAWVLAEIKALEARLIEPATKTPLERLTSSDPDEDTPLTATEVIAMVSAYLATPKHAKSGNHLPVVSYKDRNELSAVFEVIKLAKFGQSWDGYSPFRVQVLKNDTEYLPWDVSFCKSTDNATAAEEQDRLLRNMSLATSAIEVYSRELRNIQCTMRENLEDTRRKALAKPLWIRGYQATAEVCKDLGFASTDRLVSIHLSRDEALSFVPPVGLEPVLYKGTNAVLPEQPTRFAVPPTSNPDEVVAYFQRLDTEMLNRVVERHLWLGLFPTSLNER